MDGTSASADALFVSLSSLAADAVEQFLRRAVEARTNGWQRSVKMCFENPNYEWVAVYVLLSMPDLPDVPEDLWTRAVDSCRKYPQIVEVLCIRDQVPESTLKLLLNHSEDFISSHAAIGTWCALPKGEICDSIAAEWRVAILRAEGQEFWLGEILKSDSSLALDWVLSRVEKRTYRLNHFILKEVEAAISVLNSEQRAIVLQHIDADDQSASEIVLALANNDL